MHPSITQDGGLASWVYDIAIDPFDPTTLYAALGLYKSSDGGGLWSSASSGDPEGQVVRSLALDPGGPGLLYAGTNGGEIFKSTDVGV